MTYRPSEREQNRLAMQLHLILVLLLALHLYVLTLPARSTPIPKLSDPESAWWGFWPVTAVPTGAVVGSALLILGCIVWGQIRVRSSSESVQPKSDRWQMGALLSIAFALLVAFVLFPIVHTRWGDAYILANGLSWPEPSLRLTRSWQAPLDLFIHSQVWHWLHEPLGWQDGRPVYRLLSPIAGALYLGASIWIAQSRLLRSPPWLTFGLLVTPGLMQLFFGYIENYSFVAALILLFLGVGLAVVRGRSPLWLAATLLALAVSFHPSALIYLPALAYLGWREYRQKRALIETLLSLAVPLLLGLLLVLIVMESGGHGIDALLGKDRPGGGDGRWLVPLFETTTRWEHYTLFSLLHLRDLINQQMLTAPIVLPSLLSVGLVLLRRGYRHHAPGRNFLLIAAVSHLVLIVLWNPDYGGQRDWDLFSLAAIPLTLLLSRILPDALVVERFGPVCAPLILFQALHSAAWVYQNRLPWEWPT